VGYHYFCKPDGEMQIGRAHHEVGAHCLKYNGSSIGICLHGLKEEDFMEEQFAATIHLVNELIEKYDIHNIVGHSLLSNKTCPVFNVVDKILLQLKKPIK